MSVRPPPLHEKTPHLRQTSFTTKLSLRQNHNACKYSGRFLGLPVSQKLFQPSLRRKNVENFLTTKPLPRPRGKVFVIQYREAQKTSRIFACVMQRIIAANKVCVKILILEEFWPNLLNFYFVTNEKWHFGGQISWSLFIIKNTQFWMAKKWRNLGFIA